MTVSTATSRVDYTGNGVTTVFAVPFPFIEDSYLTVIRTVVATGAETTLTLNSGGADGYTVSGAGQPVGSVTVVTAPTGAQRLSIIRAVPGTQEADFVANDPFPAETFENGLDKLQMQINDNATRASRSPVLYDSDIDGSGRYNFKGNRGSNAADGVSATDLATVQQITSAGSGNFVQAGAGSVIRTMQDKARDIVSVKDFGAVGDGVTDDTAAFNAACSLGGSIFVPGGVYILTGQVNIPNSNTLVYGQMEGSGAAALIIYSGTGTLFSITGAGNCAIFGLRIEHIGASGSAIRVAAGEFHEIHDVIINCTSAAITDPMLYFRSSGTEVRQCAFIGASAGQFGIECDRTAGLININSIIESNGFGGPVKGLLIHTSDASPRPEGLSVRGNTFLCTGECHVEVRDILGLRIVDNMLDQGDDYCIKFAPSAQGVESVIIANNYLAAAQNPTGPTGGVAVGITSGSVGELTDCIVMGNTIEFSAYGVNFNSRVHGPQIIGNKFSAIDQVCISAVQSTHVTVANNTTRNVAGYALALVDGASGGPFVVTGNHLNASVGSVVTITNSDKFEFASNFGQKFSGWSSVTVADPGASTFANVPHGLSLTPNIAKIAIGLADTTGGHQNFSCRIISVDATNITVELFYTTVIPGDIRINAFCSV